VTQHTEPERFFGRSDGCGRDGNEETTPIVLSPESRSSPAQWSPLNAHVTIHWVGTEAGDDPDGSRFAKLRGIALYLVSRYDDALAAFDLYGRRVKCGGADVLQRDADKSKRRKRHGVGASNSDPDIRSRSSIANHHISVPKTASAGLTACTRRASRNDRRPLPHLAQRGPPGPRSRGLLDDLKWSFARECSRSESC
jgi:hypothetical protein